MKKLLSFLLALTCFTIVACQQIDLPQPPQPRDLHSGSQPYDVSLKTASYLAKLISKKDIKEIQPIINHGKDTVLFVVNYTDGWAVISADMRAVPIISCSQTGSFKSQLNNPGASHWLNALANEISNLKKSDPKIEPDSLAKSKDYQFWLNIKRASSAENQPKRNISKRRIESTNTYAEYETYLCKKLVSITQVNEYEQNTGPLLKTKWGQEEPWNTNLPFVWSSKDNKYILPPTGCVAVAMAQILYFSHYKWNIPSGLYHTIIFSGYINGAANYNTSIIRDNYIIDSPRWDLMPLYYDENAIYNVVDLHTNYVADLMADVGHRLDMKYSADGSGAHLTQSAMQSFGLTFDEKNYDENEVINQIRNGIPVGISAYAGLVDYIFFTAPKDGHQWVIDGLSETYRVMQYKYVWELVYAPIHTDNPATGGSEQINPNPHFSSPDITSYEDLYIKYEEVLPLDLAQDMGLYPDKTEFKNTQYSTLNLLMNWGWDGSWDHVRYAPNASIWSAGGYDFQYNKKIQYNIRPK